MTLRAACEPFATFDDWKAWPCDCSDTPEAVVAEFLDLASDTLAYETNYTFTGRCEEIIAPCRSDCPWPPLCMCGCGRSGGIEIPGHDPTISAVAIDGVPLDPGDYEFVKGYPHNKLYRIGDVWPATANRGSGPTLAVTVEYGHHLNDWSQKACLELTCWLVKRDNLKRRNALDPRATRATVDGVAMELAPEEKAGMPEMQKFLRLYPPGGQIVVWSPEHAPAWTIPA